MSSPLVVATAADPNFAMQLAVLLTSLSRSQAENGCSVFVLHDGFSADDMARAVAGAGSNLDIEWVSAANAETESARLPQFLSPATTFRLRMPDLLPESVDRLVYIDADTIVRRPIDDLGGVDLGGALVGAVRDPASPWAGISLPWRELDVDPSVPYFNAGILVVPLDRWRAERVGPRAFDLLRHHDLRWGDNCALNVLAGGDFAQLGPEWNMQAGHLSDQRPIWAVEPTDVIDRAVKDPAIVHFNNPPQNRPWNLGCTNPFADEWHALLGRTPWAGRRPAPPTLGRRMSNRVKRATHALFHD